MFRGIREKLRNSNTGGSGMRSSSVGYGLEKLMKTNSRTVKKQNDKHEKSGRGSGGSRSFSVPIESGKNAGNHHKHVSRPIRVETPISSPLLGSNESGFSGNSSSTDTKYYVFDSKAYFIDKANEPGEFNIFEKTNGINPTSCRLVVQILANYFRDLSSQKRDSKELLQVFKPNLHHFSQSEVTEVKNSLKTFFPYDGCSLKGEELLQQVHSCFKENINKIAMALRIIWNMFPRGIVPWDSYRKFIKWESSNNFPLESFHFRLSKFLPDKDYTFCTFAFLEFILCILLQKNKLMIDKTVQLDLIYTAGPTCFQRETYTKKNDDNETLPPVIKSYHQRGNALQRLFVGYLRSLSHEGKLKDFYLLDIFQIESYPPKPYVARSSKALTLTIPFDYSNGNDFTSLIYRAATAKQRYYCSGTSFSKIENVFLSNFEEETLKVIMTFFSESSNRYITTFDSGFNADGIHNIGTQNPRGYNDDQYAVATWLQFAKEQSSFDDLLKVLETCNNGGMADPGTLALGCGNTATLSGANFSKNDNEESSVRIGKMDLTEWIISSWKHEMFMNKVQNTLLIKLTKKIGECNWLVITCEQQQQRSPTASQIQNRRMNATSNANSNSNALNDLLDSCYNESVMT
ncbi:hypothetical protein HG535_0A07100 [Zygotorulaspora mrakii]|uniref:Meiotically up-regulated protein Msb1/Mug8 domain-containing protein n=1 Tax=Zygotorulaspora mrakii TaxID=42260 RepID=A0A7H9AWI4_ZYGMR|nr:uncharacterized protein HG535_0A07100 [Zygotorulaspora mrakii]QLG70768.1 hypothetical protein HG535_0A07100 [Zygotorulaspora mrakii]